MSIALRLVATFFLLSGGTAVLRSGALAVDVVLEEPKSPNSAALVIAGGPIPEKENNPLRLILPPVIPALANLETNIYFDNTFLALNPANYAVDVVCRRGAQQNERWTWTPSADEEARDIGDHPLTIEIRDAQHRIVANASTVVQVRDRAFGLRLETPLTLLIIGDSLTNASVYSQRIIDLAKEDSFPLRLIGTRGPGAEAQPGGGDGNGNRHEGYGGWTAERFATKYNAGIARGGPYKECGSPFLYKTNPQDEGEKPKLDFARYCDEFAGGSAPDFVTILLGCNDTFHATDDSIEERIDWMFAHYETLVGMVHDFSPDTRVAAILLVPPAASQDAFGTNYGSNQTRWQYRRNQHRVVERMLKTFGNREAENLFLVPSGLNLDPVHGFPSATVKAHARTETEIVRQSNGVHPSAEGYRQIGDSLYAWLRSFDES